jgi:3-phenylpropionate/trans-cinnamate dioxygenase ferredoxin reductase component
MNPIVIIGGGHAAPPLCAALAEAGLGSQVHLVCAEPQLPYQRPPLSKAYLKNPAEQLQAHRAEAWYAQAGISLHAADPAVAIDRADHSVTLQSGKRLPYGQLVLATGTRARRLPQLPAHLANVVVLRDAADALRLRALLADAKALTVLGGGFIGLEVAATARAQGLAVQVVEVAPRLLGRSVSAELAAHVLATHRASGISIALGAQLGAFEHDGQRLQAITVDGQRQPVDLLLLGIGAEPEDSLARACGLHCDNGVVVDAALRSSDPAILAIGDVARFPVSTRWAPAGGLLRLESVQNATDQARTAALTLQGQSPVYAALPWFWSEQGAMRLQMAGLMPAPALPGVQRHRRPGANDGSFSILHYQGDRLLCVESVNAPMDHVMSRKLMEADRNPPPAVACDPAVALKSLLA